MELVALWFGTSHITSAGMQLLLTPIVDDFLKAYTGSLFGFLKCIYLESATLSSNTQCTLHNIIYEHLYCIIM